jgi:uncharacterized protein
MNILVAGGTGFIGRRLMAALRRDGHDLTLLTRDGDEARRVRLDGIAALLWSDPEPVKAVESADAVVNLAGESVADGRWSPERKERILNSRLGATRTLVEAMAKAKVRPKVLINASAVGFYGSRGDLKIDEGGDAGKGFLAEVCVAWEREALRARALGARVVLLRIGVVMGRVGGALPRMLTPFRLGLGGRLGSGKQWFPWVHIDDVVGLIAALTNDALSGPVNAAAPRSATNADFTAALGRALGRPAILPVPAFALKLLIGEVSEMMLGGQRVVPAAAERAGYRFKFPRIEECLEDMLKG